LHDIGQIGLPEELLNKQGGLTPEEFAQIKQHTILGAEIAGPFRPATVLAPAIRHHHERWDGTGYPDKLQGPAIPMMARIVSVADGFHAMITDRPYRPKRSVAKALEILAAGSGTQWDPRLVAAFATSALPQRIAGAEGDEAKIA
jgi:HD-GYP domain-containing protein (c-di-GMP phosphodiesterase class II)